MFALRSAALVNRTRPKTFGPFLEIVTDSGGSTSCDTQPNCRTSFTKATASLYTTLLRPFVGLFLNLPVRKWALCAEFTHKTDSREDANSHKVIWCKYLSRSFCTAVDWTSQTDSGLWRSFFSWRTSTSWCWWLLRNSLINQGLRMVHSLI